MPALPQCYACRRRSLPVSTTHCKLQVHAVHCLTALHMVVNAATRLEWCCGSWSAGRFPMQASTPGWCASCGRCCGCSCRCCCLELYRGTNDANALQRQSDGAKLHVTQSLTVLSYLHRCRRSPGPLCRGSGWRCRHARRSRGRTACRPMWSATICR